MIRIRDSLPGDYWLLLTDLRQAEVDELEALGSDSEHCMRFGMLMGGARTVFIDEEPAAMFGAIDYGDACVVWAVFTRAIDRHPIAFLRESKRLAAALDRTVINYVDARNVRAVAWFRWLGFEVSEPEPYGPKGLLFHRFTNARAARHAEAA